MSPLNFPDEWGIKQKPDVFDRKHLYMIFTTNYSNTISSRDDAIIRNIAVKEIGQDRNKYGEYLPDFLVFDPEAKQKRIEDQGRSLTIPMKTLRDKVYVKLDDYGSPEELSRQVGYPVSTQFAITFMLPEDW